MLGIIFLHAFAPPVYRGFVFVREGLINFIKASLKVLNVMMKSPNTSTNVLMWRVPEKESPIDSEFITVKSCRQKPSIITEQDDYIVFSKEHLFHIMKDHFYSE